jgi:hypothetical protein
VSEKHELTQEEILELQKAGRDNGLTNEQAEAERQRCVAFAWMTDHADYVQNEPNAKKMGEYLQDNGLPFTPASLDEAFAHLEDRGALDPTPGPEEVPVAAAPVGDACPWVQPLTKQQLRVMSKEEMRAILKNKKWSRLFEEEVRNLKITKTGEVR